MGVSIEGRFPFLDHRVVEYAFSIDPADKFRPGETKPLLKGIARGSLPDRVLSRAKIGFPNQVLAWLEGDLGSLLPAIFAVPGSFAATHLPASWLARLVGSRESVRRHWRSIYAILILQIWYEILIRNFQAAPPRVSLQELFGVRR
jgi:asparagine synthase (glutamine-hydrolysing)